MTRAEHQLGAGRASEAYDVLIVGAGPTGMLAACELLRRGVRVRIVDRASEPSPFPKALLVWPRSLDLFEDLGVLPQLREAGLQINAFSYYSDRRHLSTFGFPQPLAPICLPQNETERILRERLHELGGKIEREVRLLTFDALDYSGRIDATDGVTAVLEHSDGTVERTRAPFVIGADGAGSAVRAQLGTGFAGSTYETAFALVDAEIEGFLPPDRALYYQSPAGALVIVALPNGIFRFFSSLAPGEEVSVARMQEIVDERGPAGVRITKPIWESVFRVHARHANDFQLGRVFIAGDAAHVHSPAGGQGLNTGLQDAHNLAWKIAAVVHGQAPSELLRDYGAERSAVAERVVRDTDIQTRAWLVRTPAKVRLRDAAFKVADRTGLFTRFYAPVMAGRKLAYPAVRPTQEPGGRSRCRVLGDVRNTLKTGAVFPRALAVPHGIAGPAAEPSYWSLVAVCEGDTPGWRTAIRELAAERPQLRTIELTLDAARHTGCRRQGYYLVRPDGHVAAHGHTQDLSALRAELTTWLGAPQQSV
ncbi:FAD-dependent monooxygenase [Kitasatospora sp. NPDC002040]|uniref:FAD-dependent monooxygenase n=1 Tax=Kitasatospora sp. NPDC002040 TaxID=3154661 RepID=UPI0033218C56